MTLDIPAGLLAAPHQQTVEVWLTLPDRTREVRVARPSSVLVTMDALRAPRVTAQLTMPLPESIADADYSDHRKGARLLIRAGYELGGQRWADTLADLPIRDRVLDRARATLNLTASGAEALVLDRPQPAVLSYAVGASVEAVCRDVLARTLGTYSLTNVGVTGTLLDEVTAPPGADLFDLLETVTDAADAYLYADEVGKWWLTREPKPGPVTVTLAPGLGGTLTDHTQDLTRALYASRVLVVHEWTDEATNTARRVVGQATHATHTGDAARTRVVRRSTPVGQATANAAAAALLARFRLAGGGQTATAIADYRVRPGATVSIAHPLGPAAAALVTSVRFELDTGTMTLSTRDPADTEG